MQRSTMEKMFRKEMNAIDELMHVNKQIHLSQSIHSPTFYFDLKKYFPTVYRDWIESKRSRLHNLIIRNLEKGISEGLFRKDLNATVISKLHVARIEMMHTSGMIEMDEVDIGTFIDEVFKYHIHGICNELGLKYFNEILKESVKQSES